MCHNVQTILLCLDSHFIIYVPLHDQNLLDKWLVNIGRSNIRLNKYSRVCSAHFEGGKKSDKNPVPTVFPWVKTACSRPPPKSRADPPPYRKSHPFGITVDLYPENHVSTFCRDLIKVTTQDKEVLVKPDVVVTAEACTSTVSIKTLEASTQTEISAVQFSDACTMTDENLVLFGLNKSKKIKKLFRIIFSGTTISLLYHLGAAVSKLSYGDHYKQSKGKPHKLSPLNEFFMMLCRLQLGLYAQDLAYRFQVSQPTVSRICSNWIIFVIVNSRRYQFGLLDPL